MSFVLCSRSLPWCYPRALTSTNHTHTYKLWPHRALVIKSGASRDMQPAYLSRFDFLICVELVLFKTVVLNKICKFCKFELHGTFGWIYTQFTWLLFHHSIYYKNGNKTSCLLAHQFKHQAASRLIPWIKDTSGSLITNPHRQSIPLSHPFIHLYINQKFQKMLQKWPLSNTT